MKVHYTSPEQADYPPQWKTLSQYPPRLAYWGEPIWLTSPMLSIVGSRTPMRDTVIWMEQHLPRVLRARNLTVVSGGARGVDQLAHRLSLRCGQPTICVLPSGIYEPYPLGVQPLLEEIVANGGAVISTFPDRDLVRVHHFAIRNRWIAGFSRVCFVTEANKRSGSVLTANLALEEDRRIATLPVSPLSAQGLGNLDLIINNNAQVIRDGQDLLTLWDMENPC